VADHLNGGWAGISFFNNKKERKTAYLIGFISFTRPFKWWGK